MRGVLHASIALFLADEWLNAKPWDPLLAAGVLVALASVPVVARIGIAVQRRRARQREESIPPDPPAPPPEGRKSGNDLWSRLVSAFAVVTVLAMLGNRLLHPRGGSH